MLRTFSPSNQPALRPEPVAPLGDQQPLTLDKAARVTGSPYFGLALCLLVVPLGLAWATQGAWLSVLPLGVLLLALCAWIVHEDASEERDLH